jgi:hypothetical protein
MGAYGYSLNDLEDLTQFAFDSLAEVDKAGAGSDELAYALQYFKGACYTADAILRLHPKSCYFVPWGRQVWNPTSLQVLARVLMEACANFHHFAIEPEDDNERELRFILANLDCVREREDRTAHIEKQMEKRGAKPPSIPDDWSGLSVEEQHALHLWVQRAALPDALRYWKERLRRNQYLPCDGRSRWLEDKWLYKNGEYKGRRMNAGFSGRSFPCRAKSAGVPDGVLWKLHRQFSTHVHMAPHAVDQIRAFHSVDSMGRDNLVEFPVMVSAAVLALAIGGFLQLYPTCRGRLNPELQVLLNVYPRVLRDLAEEAERETE